MKAARSPSLVASTVTSQAPGAEQAHAGGGGGGGGALSPVRTLGDAPGSLSALTDNKPPILDLITAPQVSQAEIAAFSCACGVTRQCLHGLQQSACLGHLDEAGPAAESALKIYTVP